MVEAGESKHLPEVVPCPVCGEDKWRYLGGELDHEPPCFACLKSGRAVFGRNPAP